MYTKIYNIDICLKKDIKRSKRSLRAVEKKKKIKKNLLLIRTPSYGFHSQNIFCCYYQRSDASCLYKGAETKD